jgi:hypothetical protein
VAQDGLRVRAHAQASSFRRREKLAELHAQAQAQVRALKRGLTEDAGASARRRQAAVERAAHDRAQGPAAALATMDNLERKPSSEPKKPKPSNCDAAGCIGSTSAASARRAPCCGGTLWRTT